jgi:mono/diheme cytochrome c family protein
MVKITHLRLYWLILSVVMIGAGMFLFFSIQTAHAYPEFAARTGETCGVCHFSPAGGGPRTPRGEIWVLDGMPDVVPGLESDISQEPVIIEEELDVTPADEGLLTTGSQLYELFACDGCHGKDGEGTTDAPPLNLEVISAEVISQTIRTGPEAMPAIPETMLPPEQMEAMVAFVQNLATGRIIRVEILNALGPIFIRPKELDSDENEEESGS